MSLLHILERDRLLDRETLAQVRRLQVEKGYLVEEALRTLSPQHARAAASASALLERERRRKLNVAGILRVFTELGLYPGARGLLLGLSAASALFSFPFIFSWYFNTILQHLRYSRDVQSLWVLTAVAATVLVAGTLLEFLLNAWASRCNFHISQGLVMRCWQHLLHMPYPLYRRHEQGQLMSKLTDVFELLQKHQLYVLRNLPRSLCIIAISVGVLISFHFAFVLVVLPAVLLTCMVPIAISDQAAPHLRQEPPLLGRISGFLQAAFASHWLLRFKGGEAVQRRLGSIADTHFLNQARKWLTWNLGYNSKVTLNLLSFLAVIWVGGTLYFAGSVGLGELITVYLLISMVTPRMDDVYRIYVYGQSLHASYEALDELLGAPGTAEPGSSEGTGPGELHALRLEGVSFRYKPGGSEVLRGVELELRRGQSYVVVGESGAGKSTLVDLLLGLVSPDSGRLLVNGQPLQPGARPGLWRRVSLHDQSNFVFLDRSAEANLPPEAGTTAGGRWAHLAQALGLPLWGSKRPAELSGGERQRLCLLRTLARPADLYIFDEPTSALDEANAALVMDSILAIPDAIILVISHDPGVIARFDHVIRIEAGRVTLQAARPGGGT